MAAYDSYSRRFLLNIVVLGGIHLKS